MKTCNQCGTDFEGKRCDTCLHEYQRRWYQKYRDEILASLQGKKLEIKHYNRLRNQEIKRQVLKAYGGFCACCGEINPSFLTIDHINNDGGAHRAQLGAKGRGMNFYRWLIKNNFPPGHQVLCFNCNCGRSVNGGVCPHIEERKGRPLGHSFEQSGPGDTIINLRRPDGHAQLDQKYDKGMRSPWIGMIGHQDAGLVSPETSEQDGSGHMDSGYSGTGGTGV